eukprot:COSAG02_NODE_476_length_21528_cov_95.026459_2_plen_176_part_00
MKWEGIWSTHNISYIIRVSSQLHNGQFGWCAKIHMYTRARKWWYYKSIVKNRMYTRAWNSCALQQPAPPSGPVAHAVQPEIPRRNQQAAAPAPGSGRANGTPARGTSANSDFLEFHPKIRSSLHAASLHCKLKLIHILYNGENCRKFPVRTGTMSRTCTGNSWNFYEFHRWIRNS